MVTQGTFVEQGGVSNVRTEDPDFNVAMGPTKRVAVNTRPAIMNTTGSSRLDRKRQRDHAVVFPRSKTRLHQFEILAIRKVGERLECSFDIR